MAREWTLPSMVSVNRLIQIYSIPIVIALYGVFLWIDHDNIDDPVIKQHIQNIKNSGGIDGLVLGGSNSVFSLVSSVLIMSATTG